MKLFYLIKFSNYVFVYFFKNLLKIIEKVVKNVRFFKSYFDPKQGL